MEWKPNFKAWERYIALEWRIIGTREQKLKRSRMVYERFCLCHPKLSSYLKYADWEKKMGNLVASRTIYERALQILGEQAYKSQFFISFTELEMDAGEIQRVRKIFQFALDYVPVKFSDFPKH